MDPLRLAPKTSPPICARVIHASDVDEMRAIFTTWQGRFEQLTSGLFQGKIQLASGSFVRIFSVEANQRMLLRGHDSDGLITFCPLTAITATSLFQGRQLDAGQLVVKGCNAEVDHYSARGVNPISLALRPEVLQDAVRSLLSVERASFTNGTSFSEGWAVHSLSPDAFLELNRQFARLLNCVMADPSLMGTP